MRGVEPGICTICPPFHKYCGQEVDILPRTTKCRRVCIAPDNRVFTPKRPCGKPVTLRLEELGFTAAAQVTCILKGRRGHMSAYQIQGTVIALRPQNAREVLVRVLNPG